MMKNALSYLVIFLVLCTAFLIIGRNLTPCLQPIAYSIGSIDPGFHTSREDFLSAIQEATGIWEAAAHKKLFTYVESGGMPINAVFDNRQVAEDTLQKLGYNLDASQKSYDAVKAHYETLKNSFDTKKAKVTALKAAFDAQTLAYEKDVAEVKSRAATQEDIDRIERERQSVNASARNVNAQAEALQPLIDEINGLVSVLKQMQSQQQAGVDQFNAVGSSLGPEYEAGLYIHDLQGDRINLFVFTSHEELVRLLEHELGHALGLPHIDDPKAVMYRLNSSKNEALTQSDIQILDKVCRLK